MLHRRYIGSEKNGDSRIRWKLFRNYTYFEERNGYVRSIDIAHETGFSKPSVSRAVSILKKEGLVEIDPLNQILLTDKGREIAEGIYERHRVLTKFFEHIGVDADVAAADACKIEHIISSQTFERIKEKFNLSE